MAQLSLDCPYPSCLAEKAGFSVSQFYGFPAGSYTYVALMECGVCHNGVVAKFEGAGFLGKIRARAAAEKAKDKTDTIAVWRKL